jgi:hypothetical protein
MTVEEAAEQAAYSCWLAWLAGYGRIRVDVRLELLKRERSQLLWLFLLVRKFAGHRVKQARIYFPDPHALNRYWSFSVTTAVPARLY